MNDSKLVSSKEGVAWGLHIKSERVQKRCKTENLTEASRIGVTTICQH